MHRFGNFRLNQSISRLSLDFGDRIESGYGIERRDRETLVYVVCMVCIIQARWMHSKKLIELLKGDGWVLSRTKGSHHIFTHKTKSGHICIPHPRKDLGMGLI